MMLDMSTCQPPAPQDHEAFDAALYRACAAIGLEVNRPQRERMYAHFLRVVRTNRQFNLTRITAPADAAVKHYADSLTLLAVPWIDAGRPLAVLDVGTGAGFPAVPLAIMCEHWDITAIDGTGRKARFVGDTATVLGLANVHARHARAADLARENAGTFDLVVLRAVAKIAAGLKEVYPLIRPGGAVVFYKTAHIDEEELIAGSHVARSLGMQRVEPFRATLPFAEGPIQRRLIPYQR